jgi:hypothetical protein
LYAQPPSVGSRKAEDVLRPVDLMILSTAVSAVLKIRVGRQAGLHKRTRRDEDGRQAADYQVAFSLPEIDPEVGSTQVLIADKADAKPLPESQAPLRLVIPTDKVGARSVSWLRSKWFDFENDTTGGIWHSLRATN